MPYIDNPSQLPSIGDIPLAATAKGAILRPTQHFKIETADNPDMAETLKRQKEFVAQGLLELGSASDKKIARKTQELIAEFQQSLSDKAYKEELGLMGAIKSAGIFTWTLVEDQHPVQKNYYTDQVFATDVGQYYDKNGQLCFIPASFKNEQRRNEERLATAQAANLDAEVQTLRSETGTPLTFEGGDIRQMIGRKLFFIGQGHRSDPKTARKIAEMSGYFVVPIKLLLAQFYHLDCCFLPLPCDAAAIYEGEYQQDDVTGQLKLDEQGWPQIIPGTETMAANSRALIRGLYPPHKLVLLSKAEALAFATNAVVLQNPQTNRFNLFINGTPDEAIPDESVALSKHQISLTQKSKKAIVDVTKRCMRIVETPYSTMHGSGGSVRCTVLELAYQTLKPHQGNPNYFSDKAFHLERRMDQDERIKRRFTFFAETTTATASVGGADCALVP